MFQVHFTNFSVYVAEKIMGKVIDNEQMVIYNDGKQSDWDYAFIVFAAVLMIV